MIQLSSDSTLTRRAALLAVAAATALLLLAAAARAQAAVEWRVVTESNTAVAPGGEQTTRIGFDNKGSTPSDGSEIKLTVTLPSGMTGVSISEAITTPLSCSDPAGATIVTCTGSPIIVPRKDYNNGRSMDLKVLVDPAAPEGVLALRIKVEGGGAAVAAETVDPVQVTATEPGFGIEAFDTQMTTGGAPFTQASGHPELQSTEFDVTSHSDPNPVVGSYWPIEDLRDVVGSLPAGLVGNPTGISQCTDAQLIGGSNGSACPPESQVGSVIVRVGVIVRPVALYNMVPPPGVPARFAFNTLNAVTVLDADVRSSGDYGVNVVAKNIPQALPVVGNSIFFWGVPAAPSHDDERLCLGSDSEGTTCPASRPPTAFFRTPTSCGPAGESVTRLRADSWQHPGTFVEAPPAPPHAQPGYPYPREDWGAPLANTGCDQVPFEPTLNAAPTVARADSPTGLRVDIGFPQDCWEAKGTAAEAEDTLCQADLKEAMVTLPDGMTLNAAAAGGREGCTPAQIGLSTPVSSSPVHFDEAAASCPDGSKIGTVEIETPLLGKHDDNGEPVTDPEGHPVLEPLEGSVYLAQQEDNPFGSLLAFYVVAEGSGVRIKQAGEVSLDPKTGRVTTTFSETPQQPFANFHLEFYGGPRATLRTPMNCGTYAMQAAFTPWSGGADAHPQSSFAITQGCGGGFDPKLQAGTANPLAGTYSPFNLRIAREDGTQELGSLHVSLPAGLVSALRDYTYCPDATLAAISSAPGSGRREEATPSCPASSRVGSVTVGAGAGVDPFYTDAGRAYIAGPYKGAPVSLAVVTPAVAGPFDLGSVLVRNPIYVDPATAQLTLDSDPLPTVLHGIPLDLRDVRVRYDHTLNPTNCDPMQVASRITSSQGASADRSVHFQVAGCDRLGFKPKLQLALKGPTHRAAHPALRAVLRARAGDANIADTTVLLPKTEFLENAHIRTVCTRVQYAAAGGGGAGCPKGSAYGYAKAWTPLLAEPLQGPVYLRSNGGERELPDLVASLGGQIHVDLVGYIDSVRGRIRNRFAVVPDAPVSKFELNMQGGKKGLLANNTELCRAKPRASVLLGGQNGKLLDVQPRIKVKCGKKGRGR